jgi:hypothetical protein
MALMLSLKPIEEVEAKIKSEAEEKRNKFI